MSDYNFILWIPLLPLGCFILLGISGRRYVKSYSGVIATAALLVSVLLSLYTAYHYFLADKDPGEAYPQMVVLKHAWLQFSPGFAINMGVLLDPISVMMIVIVTFISLMVHIFSLGYMKGEERFATYFAFLSLFTFSMLGLVLSSNIFQIYIFWELVGVSSYLLIGFYYDRPSAVAASKKAFIVTRFADLGFLIGILILSFYAGTLDFSELIQRLVSTGSPQSVAVTTASFAGISMLTWGLTLVFAGGAGKSAMFPLHIWLPDAMEGPTPVSALIHAATMVVAGVYLVARLFPVFIISPVSLQIVAYVGVLSALFAAIIACTQTDIKRVLAYSTMSQIGYMMFALGVTGFGVYNGLGFTASMFHLFTHAFFKALLFLGAGMVIHMVHSNEMKDMGGLRKAMPLTHISFLLGCLAISGLPPFAGFFSKEEILTAAYSSNKLVYAAGLLTSGITAFYMFRLYFSIFWHTPRRMHEVHGEGSVYQKIPLLILSVGAVFAGFVPFGNMVTADRLPLHASIDIRSAIAPVLLAITGILLAYRMYFRQNYLPQKISGVFKSFYNLAYRKFYIDEIYLFITRKILFNSIGKFAGWFDKIIVDGGVNALAATTGRTSHLIRKVQSGKVQSYALYFFCCILILALLFIYLWK